jgi:2-oxoglutarate dehydrogenase E1 component
MTQQFRSAASGDDYLGAGDPGAIAALVDADGAGGMQQQPRSTPGGQGEAALVEAYRQRGFLAANLDPLRLAAGAAVPELDPAQYGVAPASPLLRRLRAAYCSSIGWDFGHIRDGVCRRWLAAEAENEVDMQLAPGAQARCLTLLARTAAFETGLARRLPGARLFGLGGAETFNLALDAILTESVRLGVAEVVVGGMHRGRFNLLANVCGKPLTPLVAEILGKPAVPEGLGVSSDVSYHLGYAGDREIAGRRLRISVSAHPSHLQLIPIITHGRARARQDGHATGGRASVLPLLLHTDASFAGQGLVAEMFQMSKLGPFDLGGTIHVVINNQLGFTTEPDEARSAHGCADIARLVEAPVLHVNGDDVAAVQRVALVAATWRATFASDIVIDLVCYRRPGHNEIDEPRFTQPTMYRAIDAMTPVHELYAAQVDGGAAIASDAAAAMDADLKAAFDAAKSYLVNRADWFDGAWRGLGRGLIADMLAPVATGLPVDQLQSLGRLITDLPAGFTADPKVAKFLAERRRCFETGSDLTWAAAETLALASLANAGTPVRFGGQDALRGAFTQRHWQVHDAVTGARHLVLQPAARDPRTLQVHNTPLIEHAVLCFEYGITLDDPHRLNVWEAQFGEFLNIAQPVFDQCIACGEDRWLRASGLVILLPHGLDGGGPDHSTGRPERLLAACAGGNIQVVNASTPANYFHLLRRQMLRSFRKPLVVLTPKALLRHKACVSPLADLAGDTRFQELIADGPARDAQRVILCTGKVSYLLADERARRKLEDKIVILRVEQLHPLPEAAIHEALARHPKANLVWCEEEPANMGYHVHLDRTLERLAGRTVGRAGRPASATPASGVKYWLEAEEKAYLAAAFG